MNERGTPIPEILTQPLPYLTADLPGVGGIIKQQVEDFVVEEIPAYLPEGSGEFLFLWIEKRGLSAEQLTSHLARALGIAHQDIGTAGLKDRHAVTRQWVSVPAKCEPKLSQLQHEQIQILSAARHRNKLRTGHLRGNRFSIVIRRASRRQPDVNAPEQIGFAVNSDVPLEDVLPRAQQIIDRLREFGVPNYFGEQRFGRDDETLQLGFDLLRGIKTPGDIPRARRKFLLRLALSATQSALFNRALAERITAGTLQRAFLGDVMQVVASRGQFVVEDVEREQPRVAAGEIVPTGPIFGPKMIAPAGDIAAREAQLLAACNLSPEAFTKYANLTSGTRRPYAIRPADLQLTQTTDGLRVEFALPAGCYATVLLRELIK